LIEQQKASANSEEAEKKFERAFFPSLGLGSETLIYLFQKKIMAAMFSIWHFVSSQTAG
jgi:hypothetical protein